MGQKDFCCKKVKDCDLIIKAHFHSLLANQKEISLEIINKGGKKTVPLFFEPVIL